MRPSDGSTTNCLGANLSRCHRLLRIASRNFSPARHTPASKAEESTTVSTPVANPRVSAFPFEWYRAGEISIPAREVGTRSLDGDGFHFFKRRQPLQALLDAVLHERR